METVLKTTNKNGDVVFRTANGQIVHQGVRKIKPGIEFNHLIDTSDVKFTSTFTEGSVDDTVSIMCNIIKKHHGQVKELANSLKRDTRYKTLKSIWDFVFNHIQYKKDTPGIEQLSTPARIWLNRSIPNTPSDCDDHSLFVGSLLYCLGIPFSIRIAGYEGKPFSHVYVVVGDVCIDTVLHRFNCEAEYTSKKDKQMQIETLAGVGADPEFVDGLGTLNQLHESGDNYDTIMQRLHDSEQVNGVGDSNLEEEEKALRVLGETQLETTLKEYELEPEKYHALGFGQKFWLHMKAALQAIKDGESLDGIIIKLTDGSKWERENLSPLNGMAGENGETIGLLSALDGFFKKFRRKIKKFGRYARKTVKKAGKFIAKGFKKVAKFLMKINPINIAIRAVLRSRIKNNKKGLALKMGYGLLSAAQAKQLGISTKDYNAAKRAYSKFAKKYRFLGGKESKLRRVLASAWQKAAQKASLPYMNLAGDLGQLEGRRRRRRRRKRRASAQKLALLKKSNTQSSKPMSKYEKERLAFLKLVHKDIAKQELGVVATTTAIGSAAIAKKVAMILVPIFSILKAVGLGDMIKKMKEKRISNLSERIKNETDPAKRLLLEQKKSRAENNLVIFNRVLDKKKPAVKLPVNSNYNVPNPQISTDPGAYQTESGQSNSFQPITANNTKQAGMNPLAIGALLLVGGGLLWGANKKK
ncbi:hypothetical protein [Marinifilum sp. D737]|uniref:hypothetical protein n=1 Tax=Marinifilum sp. D737 TaxID=2969628 RepID=UPI0022744544|nr:hypothetical protein [Marinifilum sp. D737]MCY1634864.1 hypothetical protein [Marinifilum sp. D737]